MLPAIWFTPPVRLLGEDEACLEYSELVPEVCDALYSSLQWLPLIPRPLLKNRVQADGTHLMSKRDFAMFSDEATHCIISHTRFPAQPMTPMLRQLQEKLNLFFGDRVDSVVVNRYWNGGDAIGPHYDTAGLGETGVLTIIFGAQRVFRVCSREPGNPHVLDVYPAHGWVLHMKGKEFQNRFIHSVPEDPSCTTRRLSLTWRIFADHEKSPKRDSPPTSRKRKESRP